MAVSSWAARDDVFDAHHDVANYRVRIAAKPKTPFYGPVV
jgi:hypothetical protein